MPKFTLNRDAVRQPVQMAVVRSTEVVNFCCSCMTTADLSKAPQLENNRIVFTAPELGSEERKSAYEAWILARGFHDVLRGAKETLEQAIVYLRLLEKQPSTQQQLDELTASQKKKAQRAGFDDLLKKVNKRLSVPLEFPDALLSLQQARNCLEHRGGIVGDEDCRGASKFALSFPRLKFFYLREGKEVELEVGSVVQPQGGQSHAIVMVRLDLQRKELAIGDHLALSASEFNSIAFAVMTMGEHIANHLPGTITAGDAAVAGA
ncbi:MULTISPECIES: hypothetical protein [unclassified Bradyrhizobium]|uniref:hypothetical protein n=1 Tax=unclassified Bradyrhizobium TaxID=2631580 RepID=UPI003397F70A